MPDENLGGKFVYIITVLGIFVLLVGIMPSGFYITASDYQEYYVPDEAYDQFTLEQLDLQWFENDTITYMSEIDIDFNPEINYRFDVTWYAWGITFWHWERDWPFKIAHTMTIFREPNSEPYLTKPMLEDNWDANSNQSTIKPIYCNDISIVALFADSNSTRNNITDAWDDGSLEVGLGFGYSNITTTSQSGWDMVGRLLLFQPIDLGMGNSEANTVMTGIIALPIWAIVAYLLYRLILMAIPFVGD